MNISDLDMTTVRISEIFLSLEGEGPLAGRPTLFVRFFGCNLTCQGFGNDGKTVERELVPLQKMSRGCDSAYAWHHDFKHTAKTYSLNELHAEIRKHLDGRNRPQDVTITFTGGEPMLYSKHIMQLIEGYPDYYSRIGYLLVETNGTKPLLPLYGITHSISPKLSISGENPDVALNVDYVAQHIVDNDRGVSNTYFKFVTDGSKKLLLEIEDYLQRLAARIDFLIDGKETAALSRLNSYIPMREEGQLPTLELLHNVTYLMPVGVDLESQTTGAKEIVDQCLEYNFKFSPRLHILLFGNTMGT